MDKQLFNQQLFNQRLQYLIKYPPTGFMVVPAGMFGDDGEHPADWTDSECAYASGQLRGCNAKTVLDIGSYRHFVHGLAAAYDVTYLDVRPQKKVVGQKRIVSDIRNIPSFFDQTFDAVVSLCTLEHVGLGRYGDEFDMQGDKKAYPAIKRVLKSDGHLIFTIPIKNGKPVIWFNGHRVYDYQMIQEFRNDMEIVDERFIDIVSLQEIQLSQVRTDNFDLYCGHWRKP